MKKVLLWLAVVLVSMIVLSCDENSIQPPLQTEVLTANKTNDFAISQEEALANLYSFLEQTSGAESRASELPVVKSVTAVSTKAVSRSADDEDGDLVYVVNFEEESGYAILAADTRVGDKIIAIVESGNLDEEVIEAAVDMSTGGRPIFEGYPTSGPGYLTLEETGNELYMNPNTVNLYDDTIMDTLVGDFSLDDRGATDENGNLVGLGSTVRDAQLAEYATALCFSYAEDSKVGGGSNDKPESYHRVDPNESIEAEGAGANMYFDTINDTGWLLKASVNPLLRQFSGWTQHSPFNDLYPKRHKYVLFGNSRRAPAGCFPLAVAKIMTYFQYPDSYVYKGETVNWAELTKRYTSVEGKKSAATLLLSLSDGFGCWYFYNGTFTFPGRAVDYMCHLGYRDADSHAYEFERVSGMLDLDKPVIIYGMPNINITQSHCWNIDGYKVSERSYTVRSFAGNDLLRMDNVKERTELVHCDFGWEGRSNGYYASGVFNLKKPVELDGAKSSSTTNYNSHLRIIDYIRPNK